MFMIKNKETEFNQKTNKKKITFLIQQRKGNEVIYLSTVRVAEILPFPSTEQHSKTFCDQPRN